MVRHRVDEGPPPSAVVFGALPLRPGGAGVSTYIHELLSELPHYVDGQLSAVVAEDAVQALPPGILAIKRHDSRGVRRTLQGMAPIGAATTVIHGLDVDLPLRARASLVSTVHDLAVFDTPWAFPAARVVGERLVVARSLLRADVIIADSSFTAERVHAIFGRESVVVPLAPSRGMRVVDDHELDDVRTKYKLPEKYVLHVGTVEPRKNIDQLAKACNDLAIPLVLAGAVGWGDSAPARAKVLGFVPQRDLPALYGAAMVAAYSSVYEGFGLPPVEAMACGCAVVSTRVPSLEFVGDGAVIARSARAADLLQALRAVVEDDGYRLELARRGRVAVDRLSWSATAATTAKVYEMFGVPSRADADAHPSRPDSELVRDMVRQLSPNVHFPWRHILSRDAWVANPD